MIIQDKFNDKLIRTVSDAGFYIVNQDGVKYAEAIDPKEFIQSGERSYTESDEKLEGIQDEL